MNELTLVDEGNVQIVDAYKKDNFIPSIGIDLSSREAVDLAVIQMENMIYFKDKVIHSCVKLAKPGDITSMGKGKNEKPYIGAAFCEQVLARLGGSAQLLDTNLQHMTDGHYRYTVTIKVEIPHLGSTTNIGLASTHDQFLGSKQKMAWNDKTNRKDIPMFESDGCTPIVTRQLTDIVEHNILQMARTRAIAKCIRCMLGMQNMTWEELEAMGHTRENSGRVKYDGKGAPKKDDDPVVDQGLLKKLKAHVGPKGNFTWNEVGNAQKELGLDGVRSMDLGKEDMTKLLEYLDKVAEFRKAKS